MNAKTITLIEALQYNDLYDKGDFRGSEATKKNISAINYFINLRDNEQYQYAEEYTPGEWERLDITDGYHTKYGWNYIYLDHTRKLYRTKESADEFYHH